MDIFLFIERYDDLLKSILQLISRILAEFVFGFQKLTVCAKRTGQGTLNNFIPSDIALLISCSLDPPLEDPPDVNCLMTYKNPKEYEEVIGEKKAGLACRAAALPIDLELIP